MKRAILVKAIFDYFGTGPMPSDSNRVKVLLTAIAALLVPAIGVAATTESELQVRYETLKFAIAAHDGKAVLAVLTTDFQSISVDGSIENGAQMVSGIAALKPDPNKNSATTLLRVVAEGDHALVDQKYEMNTQKAGNDGKMHNVKLTTVSADVWQKTGGAWLMKSTATKQLDYEVDGQLIVHKQSQ